MTLYLTILVHIFTSPWVVFLHRPFFESAGTKQFWDRGQEVFFSTKNNTEETMMNLGGGFKYLLFPSLLGEDSHFDYSNIFQMGWNHKPVNSFFRGRLARQIVVYRKGVFLLHPESSAHLQKSPWQRSYDCEGDSCMPSTVVWVVSYQQIVNFTGIPTFSKVWGEVTRRWRWWHLVSMLLWVITLVLIRNNRFWCHFCWFNMFTSVPEMTGSWPCCGIGMPWSGHIAHPGKAPGS